MTAPRVRKRRPRLFLYVQSLLGVGHLARAAALARAFAGAGYRTDLVSGGLPVPTLDPKPATLHQLPPLHCADGDFKTLLDQRGQPVDGAWRTKRRDELLSLFDAAMPDVVIIETFPFGRRQMRFELLPLLEAAEARRPRPLIVSSVRDVLQTGRRPDRIEESAALIEERFDHVLVHGDPALIAFHETFPLADRIATKVQHTGYMGGPPVPQGAEGDPGWDEVVISTGGGAVGAALVDAALAARSGTALSGKTWRILLGRNAAAPAGKQDNEGLIIEPARADFRQLLANCAVSVSQGGYNTVMDILAAQCRAVVVPFAGQSETEQTFRARRLADSNRLELVEEGKLTGRSLAAALDRAAGRLVPLLGVAMDGAAESVRLVDGWLTIDAAGAVR